MFGFVALFPTEQFIFRTNIILSKEPDSRIVLAELKMLSPDVLTLVKKQRNQILAKEEYDWGPWIEQQERILAGKHWYELNVMNVITKMFKA